MARRSPAPAKSSAAVPVGKAPPGGADPQAMRQKLAQLPPETVQALAQAMAMHGQGGDNMLMHVNPSELAQLQKQSGNRTANPVTGLPQAFDTADGGQTSAGDGGENDAGTSSGSSGSGQGSVSASAGEHSNLDNSNDVDADPVEHTATVLDNDPVAHQIAMDPISTLTGLYSAVRAVNEVIGSPLGEMPSIMGLAKDVFSGAFGPGHATSEKDTTGSGFSDSQDSAGYGPGRNDAGKGGTGADVGNNLANDPSVSAATGGEDTKDPVKTVVHTAKQSPLLDIFNQHLASIYGPGGGANEGFDFTKLNSAGFGAVDTMRNPPTLRRS